MERLTPAVLAWRVFPNIWTIRRSYVAARREALSTEGMRPCFATGLAAFLAASGWNAAAQAQNCGAMPDVITAPSNKIGNHACDSDHDGAVKDSNYCYCSDCAIQPERCHRRGDPAFCRCDPALQYCRPRPCLANGACQATDPTSYYWSNDCNDYNRDRYPGNCEICGDTVDNNCNGSTTDCMSSADADGDGYSTPADCNDNNPQAHPGATEIECNAVDEDCNGTDLCGSAPQDQDGDGYNAPADCNDNDAAVHPGAADVCGDRINSDCDLAGLDCAEDQDQDGVTFPADCDDTNPGIHPGVFDLCGDAIDQDCSGADRACVFDQDRDGYDAVSAGGDDCNDLDSSVHVGALEVCGDGIDQDCSGADVSCAELDQDGDGHAAVFFGGDDCDDHDDSVYPGAPEACGDGIDSNCDLRPDIACGGEMDRDGDGFGSALFGDSDCNDFDSRINPLSAEVCGDGVDNDCNGVADDGCAAPSSAERGVLDFVNSPTSSCACDHTRFERGSSLLFLGLIFLLGSRWRRRS